MKFTDIFKRNSVSIQKQMEQLNLTIDEIKFLQELTGHWFKDYKGVLKKIKEGNTLFNLPLMNPEQVKLVKEQIEQTFIERFEKQALVARDISKKLQVFIDSVL